MGFASLALLQPFVFAALTGSKWLYTIIQLWAVLSCVTGCIATSASGALMMDCLPADEDGSPLSASRDLNLHNWAGTIPSTGFPLLLVGITVFASPAPRHPAPSHYPASVTSICMCCRQDPLGCSVVTRQPIKPSL
jgi:hypothetical protein